MMRNIYLLLKINYHLLEKILGLTLREIHPQRRVFLLVSRFRRSIVLLPDINDAPAISLMSGEML